MFNPLKSLKSALGRRTYLGVDIGTTSIKIAELTGSGVKPILKNYGVLESYGHLERLNNAIQTSSLKMLDNETAELLEKLVEQLDIRTTDAVASLPAFASFTTLLDVPAMSPQETAQAMEYQARALVPLPVSEVTIDWLPVGDYEDEKGIKHQQIFLISVPNEHIKKYQRIFKTAGLSLRALEIEGLSLARILTTGDLVTTLIVDIGARSTNISIAERGLLKYSAQTDFAGGSLTQSIASSLNISVRRAEVLKKQKGLVGMGGESELSTLMLPFLDVIIGEAKRVKNNYEKNYSPRLPRSEAGKGIVERVILSGGGANLLGIEKYFDEQMKLPTLKAEPFAKISYPPEVEPLIREIGAPFAVALGLGIRQFT
ncbi:MAG: type IV pilus assembly protein PilM [Candidatus Colwellbacteria bacterium]|nr:type IV pilus assembly protein PilM [Candidatus Colwellbacteria bacterium]